MRTDEFSWRNWPAPEVRVVDPQCLLPLEEAWIDLRSRLRGLSDNADNEIEWEDDHSARIRVHWSDACIHVRPWPDACLYVEQRQRGTRPSLADGLILLPSLEQALPTLEDARRAAAPYDYPQIELLDELRISGALAARLRAFSETFPSDVLEAVARWRFPEGQFAVAAACAVPGFRRLLSAHPQLAWLIAMRMLKESGDRGIRMSDWETILGMGPLWLAAHFLRLPRRRGTLTTLRKLHFECLSGGDARHPFPDWDQGCFSDQDVLPRLQKILGRRESFDAILRLDGPIRAYCVLLLAREPTPHLDLLREIQKVERARNDPDEKAILLMRITSSYLRLADGVRRGLLPPVEMGSVRSLKRLGRLANQLRGLEAEREGETCPLREETVLAFPFPDDDPRLEPLRTRAAILAMGERFGNCLAGIASGKLYLEALSTGKAALAVFREGKEAAFVFFNKTSSGDWRVKEASGVRNRPFSLRLRKALAVWCRRNGVEPPA